MIDGQERFGANILQWKYRCPVCKAVIKAADWLANLGQEGKYHIGLDCFKCGYDHNKENFNPIDVDGIRVFAFAGTKENDEDRRIKKPRQVMFDFDS
jgi:hypothetical protein